MKRFLARLGAAARIVYAGTTGACFFATAIQAGTITETDRGPVLGGLSGFALVEDFGDRALVTIPTGILNSATNLPGIPPGTILPGVTYSTPVGTGFFFNLDRGAGFTGNFLDTITGPNPLTVQFTFPQIAFGFDTNSIMGPSFEITINFAGGGSFSDTLSIPNTLAMTGFGFISSTDDMTSAVIVNPNTKNGIGFAVDNFTYANTAVPALPVFEPASLAVLTTGLAGFGLVHRRRKTERSTGSPC